MLFFKQNFQSTMNNCTQASIEHFPKLSFLPEGRSAVTLIFLLGSSSYLFLFLVRVCELRFVASVKKIGKACHISSDVAGAALMASAISCPDLFINIVATLVSEGDMGLGTIVGCGLFNVLAIPALCIFFSPAESIRLRGWSLTRDMVFFGLSLVTISVSLIDNRIEWYESASLVFLYVLYITVLWKNASLKDWYERLHHSIPPVKSSSDRIPLLIKSQSILSYGVDDDDIISVTSWSPRDRTPCEIFYDTLTWPIDTLLFWTVPKSRAVVHGVPLYPVTFICCLIWVGIVSYIISWFITVAGFILTIPDSLVGLTFIALGMSVPQATSSIIIARQGDGAMALSNSIGSAVFDNLLGLGLPWFVKSSLEAGRYVVISSRTIAYTSACLASALVIMYSAVACSSFRLNLRVGCICLGFYIVLAVFSCLLEMNIFTVGNLPFCN